MEFKLNTYHRNTSKEELIEDLICVSKKLNKDYVSRSEYVACGKFSATPFIQNFGTWINALKAAGLSIERPKNDYLKIKDQELLEDVKLVATRLGKNSISTSEYNKYGKYKIQTLLIRFTTWNLALEKAGLTQTPYKIITDEMLFEEIEKIWINKGSQPTTTDIQKGLSQYSLNTYCRHFGGWRSTLEAFIKWINSPEENEPIKELNNVKAEEIKNSSGSNKTEITQQDLVDEKADNNRLSPVATSHKTSRDINLRLRFKILQRDKFKCCFCGASPAKDPSVELHVDHIIPWTKGGETTMDNLQTLCSKCNLGKSDLI